MPDCSDEYIRKFRIFYFLCERMSALIKMEHCKQNRERLCPSCDGCIQFVGVEFNQAKIPKLEFPKSCYNQVLRYKTKIGTLEVDY